MNITFIGAAHEVTGSSHYINVAGKHILVDYGMEQGVNVYENAPLPIMESEIDYIFLTHAHIDHSGMIPLLVKRGFRGSIYATNASCDLCSIMLRDSAHIQMMEAEWKSRKAKRYGQAEPVEPIYNMEDADEAIRLLVPCDYDKDIEVAQGVRIRFTDIGHLLGSASIAVDLEEEGIRRRVVFSGDIGNINQPLIKDPSLTKEADYVVMESTYGNRYHPESKADHVSELAEVIQTTFDRGGNVVIPSFAVGRTQEILYFIRHIKEKNMIQGHDGFEVYVDSPLAVEATGIFEKNELNCFDDEAMELVKAGKNPISFNGLRLSITSDDSKEINFDSKSKVILSASGMCDAGRIRHHLKHNLWRSESSVLFVGYQSIGTLGRYIVDGAEEVKIFGEKIKVNARIALLSGISGHADKRGLTNWIQGFETKLSRVFVVHGESSVCDEFAEYLKNDLGIEAYSPYSGTKYNLISNELEYEATPIEYVKKSYDATPVIGDSDSKTMVYTRAIKSTKKSAMVYATLVAAGGRLMGVISRNEGKPNKELRKFTDQINELCNKWDSR